MRTARDISGLPPAEQEKILARREYMRLYMAHRRVKNPEKQKEYHARYQLINADRIKSLAKTYNEMNRDKKIAYLKNYREANKEKIRGYYAASKDIVKARYEANKDEVSRYQREYRKNNLYELREKARKQYADLPDSAVRSAFCVKSNGLRAKDVPDDMVPILRAAMLANRELKALNREIRNVNHKLKGN